MELRESTGVTPPEVGSTLGRRQSRLLHLIRFYVPVPLRLTFWGLVGSESLRVTFADRVPVAVGVNVTLIVQLAPAATLEPQLLVCAKSPGLVPVIEML